MNSKNLQPFRKGESRAREAGRAGGIASGEAKREKFRQLLLHELDAPATRYVPPQKDEYGLIPLDDEGHYETCSYSVRASLTKALICKAQEGDLRALDMILRLTEGEDDEPENEGDEPESEAQSVSKA